MEKKKSVLSNHIWIAYMLLGMGIVLIGTAIVLQFVHIAPENVSLYSNGVKQVSTEESVTTARFISLLTLGISGLVFFIAGGIVAVCITSRKKRDVRLKQEGVCITALATECTGSAARINYRRLQRLSCSYKAPNGTTYIFKSGFLRLNPIPYLQQGAVKVYHDRSDITHYFVDIDGSLEKSDLVAF